MSDERRSTAVSLGCGTLIIIALIVLFLGREDLEPLTTEIEAMRTEIRSLEAEIVTLRREQQAAAATLDRVAAALAEPGVED